MMHTMIGLVEQSESYEPAEQPLRNDASRRTVHRGASEPHVLDVLSPTLHVRGQICRYQVHPEKILPRAPASHRSQQANPDHGGQRKLSPDSPTELFVPDGRVAAE